MIWLVRAGVWKKRTRGDHTKVYRPNGMRFAEATGLELNETVEAAFVEFEEVHGERPQQHDTVLEIVGATAKWHVHLFEVKDRT